MKEKFKKIRTIKDQIEFFNESNRYLCEYLGIKPTKALIKGMTKYSLKGEVYMLENAELTLKEIKREYRIGAITNALPSARENEIKDLGLDKLFEVIVISAEVGSEKPDRKIYNYAVKRVGVKKKDILLVDDLPENLEGAIKAGIDNVVLVSNDSKCKKVLQQ